MRKEVAILGFAVAVFAPHAGAADARTNTAPIQSRVTQEGGLRRENVTDEQRARLREANEKFRTEQNALYEKLRTARRDLEQTAQANATDEKSIRAKASVLGQIEGDLAILRAKHYKELRTILPHDQAAQQSGLTGGLTNTPRAVAEPGRPKPPGSAVPAK